MEFYSNPNAKCAENPQSSILAHPFSDVPFQEYLNPLVRTNKLVNSLFYHPFPSRLASGLYSLSPLAFYFSRMLVEFSLTCIFQHVGKNVSIYGVHIPTKCIESIHLYSCLSPPLKTASKIFLKHISPKAEGVEKAMIFSIKIQSENMKMTWRMSLLQFCK